VLQATRAARGAVISSVCVPRAAHFS
jgi:hypothetical protein